MSCYLWRFQKHEERVHVWNFPRTMCISPFWNVNTWKERLHSTVYGVKISPTRVSLLSFENMKIQIANCRKKIDLFPLRTLEMSTFCHFYHFNDIFALELSCSALFIRTWLNVVPELCQFLIAVGSMPFKWLLRFCLRCAY